VILLKENYKNIINQLTDKQIVQQLYLSQALIFLIAVILGLFIFDSWSEFTSLFIFDDWSILSIGFLAGIVIVQIDILFMRYLPKQYFDDGGVNLRIFRNQSIGSIFVIALTVAIVEEILFRGVIQSQFGLIISSVIFAIVHYRYLFNPFLFANVVVISFVFGLIFYYTENLLVTIVMHFIVDFLLGIIYRNKFNKKGG